MQKEIQALLQLPSIKKFNISFLNKIDNFYIVGGAIRNALLNKSIKDIDFATSYSPDELINLCKSKNIKYIPTGIQYGTITIILDNHSYEITSLREDIKTNGRHAIVTYSKELTLDSKRRDFTINALYLDFNGNIHDFHRGIADLTKKEIKFIGNSKNRIQEDYLRILRFFRFYAELDGFSLEKESLASAISAKEHITKLSPERIKQELIKTLSGRNYLKSLKLLVKHQIYNPIINLPSELIKTIEKYQKNNISNPQYEILIAFSLLQNPHPKQELPRLKKHLALSNKETNAINIIISHHNQLPDLLLTPIQIKKLLLTHGRKDFLLLYQYQIFISSANISNYNSITFQITNLTIPQFPITGKDLLDLNIKEGQPLGQKLNSLRTKWINSNFSLNKTKLLSLLT